MPSYPLKPQNKNVGATMTMHHYVRKRASKDSKFDKCDADKFYVPEVEEVEALSINKLIIMV